MYKQGSSSPMFQYSLEMLRKIRVRGDRSVTAASDMKIRQREGKRKSPPSPPALCFLRNMWCGARQGASGVARFLFRKGN